jgi:hypothetical protein
MYVSCRPVYKFCGAFTKQLRKATLASSCLPVCVTALKNDSRWTDFREKFTFAIFIKMYLRIPSLFTISVTWGYKGGQILLRYFSYLRIVFCVTELKKSE